MELIIIIPYLQIYNPSAKHDYIVISYMLVKKKAFHIFFINL